jgi:hypothetical protein
LAEIARRDEADEQADDRDDDEKLEKREAADRDSHSASLANAEGELHLPKVLTLWC